MQPRSAPSRVSVVVPTFRRPALLGRCLAALLAQRPRRRRRSRSSSWTTGATRTTRQAVLAAARPVARARPLPRSRSGRHGPAAARNVGWRAARAPTSSPSPTMTASRPRAGCRPGLDAIGAGMDGACGQVVVPIPARPDRLRARRRRAGARGVRHRQLLLPAPALEAVGGFDQRFRRGLARGQRPVLRAARTGPPSRLRAGGDRRPPGPAGAMGREPPAAAQEPVQRAALPEAPASCTGSASKRVRRWRYYAILLAALAGIGALAVGLPSLALGAAAGWLALVARRSPSSGSATRRTRPATSPRCSSPRR